MPPPDVAFRERLSAPLSYWLIALVVGLSFVTAVGWYLGPWFAAGASVVALAGIVAVLGASGSSVVVVDQIGLHVGRATLEWRYLASSTALDKAAARLRRGPDADARAFVVDRPFLAQAVEVQLDDPADPHPYWLIGTRRPAQLVRALTNGRRPDAEPDR